MEDNYEHLRDNCEAGHELRWRLKVVRNFSNYVKEESHCTHRPWSECSALSLKTFAPYFIPHQFFYSIIRLIGRQILLSIGELFIENLSLHFTESPSPVHSRCFKIIPATPCHTSIATHMRQISFNHQYPYLPINIQWQGASCPLRNTYSSTAADTVIRDVQ